MILTLLGGGGFRVPLVYSALLTDHGPGRVTGLRLFDTDPARLSVVAKVLAEMAEGVPDAPAVALFTELSEALPGTDFIFSAIRVGGLEGRAADERIALEHGVIGQETVGAGGISYALRTIPVVLDIAEAVKKHAPEAWFINFTNPAGVITEVMTRFLGGKVVGICDSPVGLARRCLSAAGIRGVDVRGERVAIDYIGLNHLGWLRGLSVDGEDVLPRLLADASAIESFEEGRLFGAPWIQALGAVPNEYLHYYYFRREALDADRRAADTRGAYLERQQSAFYEGLLAGNHDAGNHDAGRHVPREGGGKPALRLWEQTKLDREETYMKSNRDAAGAFERDAADLESGGYEGVALAIMRAISQGETARLILNVPNGATLAELGPEAVIEAPCLVDADGVRPLPARPLPDYARGFVVNAKAVEQATIEAALTGSRRAAYKAFAMNPLVDSVRVARGLLDDYIGHFPQLGYLR
ncbi:MULTISPECIES: 6-phospho-beta-glucosidase [Arthrobacter]|uniref:6-phospho-beta-glucosidase n=1 Tax=Arthrobacter terricola TaxID=2547396 RepID=A0A4R5L0M4_9MICC|nr:MULTISPECIES: 6-phospho-beta-glucosidase [Arthrobacter]MBT8160053.1 6-phospho-beta-glucosidase [Arthrobacter sp. GN70]TDG01056.1 6-phospho-beta-glucosidase [Arthrobacter terricola]